MSRGPTEEEISAKEFSGSLSWMNELKRYTNDLVKNLSLNSDGSYTKKQAVKHSEYRELLDQVRESGEDSELDYLDDGQREVSDEDTEDGNMFSTLSVHGEHRLFLDIDGDDIYLAPSSTPGHYHLGFPNAIDEETYEVLMDCLIECGIIKKGNATQWEKNEMMFFRLPWIKKVPEEVYLKTLEGSQ